MKASEQLWSDDEHCEFPLKASVVAYKCDVAASHNALVTVVANGKSGCEDNKPLSEWLALTLQRQNYTVDCIYNGEDADHLLLTQQYDLVILDISLPKLNGDKVLQRLRARNNNVPVLILTANNSIEERVGGLNIG
eukprot:gene25332-27441_t